MSDGYPERIVCLTEETTETLYLLEEDWRIVGISGFTVRPERAREEKPIVSAFSNAQISKILELKPDLVLGFSDIQADIASQLIAQGVEVHVFNHRTVAGIFQMIRVLGAMVGCGDKSAVLASKLKNDLERMRCTDACRPQVYFEEWNDPLITGIGWVSELIELAGGSDIFRHLSAESLAKNRIIGDPMEVVRRDPDIIIASWCGKPIDPQEIQNRPGWDSMSAVRNREIHEVESAMLLQPGPAALTDGMLALKQIISRWQANHRSVTSLR